MKRFIEGQDRSQSTLFPERLEDYIAEDNPVRAVDVFVEELNLELAGFKGVRPDATGRPGYHPATLLKIYIYGYLNRIQSSRRLEREAQRNVELIWLTSRLTPDFKTIADFRKDNAKAIGNVCREFVLLCRRLDLFGEAVVAIDGSKFKAVNNRDKNFTEAKLKKRMEQLEESIARYLAELDRADREPSTVPASQGRPSAGQASGGEGSDAAPQPDRRAAAPRARPTDLTYRSRCTLHGHQWQGYRHGGIQRANGGGHQAPSDRGPRGHQRGARPNAVIGNGQAGTGGHWKRSAHRAG
jgi:transposase